MGQHLLRHHHGGWKRQLPDQRDREFLPTMGRLDAAQTEVALDISKIPVLDQMQQGCHDEQTEVLTDSGWCRWADYDDRALLGTINSTSGALEYQSPTALQRYRHEGKLYVTEGQRLNFALTPEHRMWVRKWDERARTLTDDYSFTTAQHLGWYAGLQAAPSGYAGAELERVRIGERSYDGDDFVALLGLIAADGWVGATENNRNAVSFCCFRSDRRDMVAALAQRLALSEVPGRPGVWKWSDAALAEWVRANLYVGDTLRAPFKRVPTLVQGAAQRQIDVFLSFFGDQHVARGTRQFYTTSPQLADDLQVLILKTGARAAVGKEKPIREGTLADGRVIRGSAGEIVITQSREDKLSVSRKLQVTEEDYSGEVFCATVPNGLLVTRRERKVLISGNSCTGHGGAGLVMFDQQAQGQAVVIPSRAMIYYDARIPEGTTSQDAGAEVRDAVKGIATYGVVPDTEFPYDDQVFKKKPTQKIYADATKQEALVYEAVAYPHFNQAIASGFPVVFGFTVYESFESAEVAKTGVVPIPAQGEQVLGGHCVWAYGFNSRFKASGNDKFPPRTKACRNSWGSWGDHGNFVLPQWFWDSGNASDAWVIRRIGAKG